MERRAKHKMCYIKSLNWRRTQRTALTDTFNVERESKGTSGKHIIFLLRHQNLPRPLLRGLKWVSLKVVFMSTPDITFKVPCWNPFSHDKLLVTADVSHTLIISCLNFGPWGYECQVHCDTKQWRSSQEKKKRKKGRANKGVAWQRDPQWRWNTG